MKLSIKKNSAFNTKFEWPTFLPTLYQERAVFGKMKMDPAKRAQTQNAGEVSSLHGSFPNPLN